MFQRRFTGSGMMTVVAAVLISSSAITVATAATPTVRWQTTDGATGTFSADGSSVLIATTTGFQMRRTTDGVLEKTITLPVGSRGYDDHAFSPDKQLVATTVRAGGITRIDLWRTSDGALARTINSDAVRNNKSLDFSSTGLIEAHERFAYGGGGMLRIFRVSDGGLVTTLGPYARNSSPNAKFSPNGQYIGIQDQFATVVRVLRTSDWGTAVTFGNSAGLYAWSPNSATLWTSGYFDFPEPWRQNSIPSGSTVRSVLIDGSKYLVSAFTPDGRFFLNGVPNRDRLEIRRTSDLGATATYTVGTTTWSGTFNSAGTSFTYATCPISGTPCTFYMATTPPL